MNDSTYTLLLQWVKFPVPITQRPNPKQMTKQDINTIDSMGLAKILKKQS